MTGPDRRSRKYDETELVRPDISLTTKAITYLNIKIDERVDQDLPEVSKDEMNQMAKDFFVNNSQNGEQPTIPGIINGSTRFIRRRLDQGIDYDIAHEEVKRVLEPILLVNDQFREICSQDRPTLEKTIETCLKMISNAAQSTNNPYAGDSAWKK